MNRAFFRDWNKFWRREDVYEAQECVARYKRLLQLIDEDFNEIAQGIQGRVLESYRDILVREKEILMEALKSMQRSN